MKYLAIFIAGGLGSLTRFSLSTYVNDHTTTFFPLGTLVVNLVGSFFIGFIFEWFEHILFPVEIRLFLTVGFLGGFTTFSTYMLENSTMIRMSEFKFLFINVIAHNALGLIFVLLGILSCQLAIKLLMK